MDNTDYTKVWEDFKKGDRKAFSVLYETYFDVLYRYGMKFISNEEVVKDCIQDLFVKLYNSKENIALTTTPKFYLLFSLKNLIIDYSSRYNRITYISPEELPFIATYQFETQDDSLEIDDETKKKFEKVMSLLNPRQKEALYLRFQLELSYEEVSQLLNVNYQSARNLIHRAIMKVRENMEFSMFIVLFLEVCRG
ncbi:RNA polymerase sigma factor [Bacteroides sp. 519]|nr:RNA polymerase sigma factor [Bacteroides sp. 519]